MKLVTFVVNSFARSAAISRNKELSWLDKAKKAKYALFAIVNTI